MMMARPVRYTDPSDPIPSPIRDQRSNSNGTLPRLFAECDGSITSEIKLTGQHERCPGRRERTRDGYVPICICRCHQGQAVH